MGLPDKCQSYFDQNRGCQIYDADLEKIKFFGKKENGSIKIPGGGRVYLKTFKETEKSKFPLGIKVKMEVKDHNVNIPKPTSGSIILWKDYETEFKVKKEGDGKYSLENVVNMNAEVKKFGIDDGNCDDELGCTIGSKVNVYMSGTQYRRDAYVKDTTKKITYRWGDMKSKGTFTSNLVFKVPKEGIGLSSSTGEPTKSVGTFSSIEKGNYVIKSSSVGSDNNSGSVTYLYKEEPGQNHNPYDDFFA